MSAKPTRVPVVAYIHPDDSADKQERTLLKLCRERAFELRAVCNDPSACAQMVAAGLVGIVVAMVDHHVGLRHLVDVAGGNVVFAREHVRLPTLREWLARAVGRGASTRQIAQGVGEDTTDVARLLHMLGLQPPPERGEDGH